MRVARAARAPNDMGTEIFSLSSSIHSWHPWTRGMSNRAVAAPKLLARNEKPAAMLC